MAVRTIGNVWEGYRCYNNGRGTLVTRAWLRMQTKDTTLSLSLSISLSLSAMPKRMDNWTHARETSRHNEKTGNIYLMAHPVGLVGCHWINPVRWAHAPQLNTAIPSSIYIYIAVYFSIVGQCPV